MEAVVNVGLGFIVAVVTQRIVFPLLGIHISFTADLAVASVFTAVSLLRTFAVRRFFEWIASRSQPSFFEERLDAAIQRSTGRNR